MTEQGDQKSISTLGEMIQMIARALVDFPNQVEVFEVVGENTTVIELKVAQEDVGKVIGKQGKTAHAMRILLTGASTKLQQRAVLEIID